MFHQFSFTNQFSLIADAIISLQIGFTFFRHIVRDGNPREATLLLNELEILLGQFMSPALNPETVRVDQNQLNLEMLPVVWLYPSWPYGIEDPTEED